MDEKEEEWTNHGGSLSTKVKSPFFLLSHNSTYNVIVGHAVAAAENRAKMSDLTFEFENDRLLNLPQIEEILEVLPLAVGANSLLVHRPRVWFSIGAHSLIFGTYDQCFGYVPFLVLIWCTKMTVCLTCPSHYD